jgi:leader peptidase (prepilin peptidase)/N-methyltransferase
VLAFLSFLYGESLGSFVQVLVTRLHVANMFNTRSKCLSCGTRIKWFDLVPVLSYLVLRGKCRECKSSFGVSSLITELLFGAVFVCVHYTVLLGKGVTIIGFSWLVYYSALVIILGSITIYDIKHKMIPGIFLGLLLLMSALSLIARSFIDFDLVSIFTPLIIALPFSVLYIVTRGKSLGFGDILLYLAVGGFLDVWQGLAVLVISVWMGSVFGIALYVFNKKNYTMKTAIPFAPFIVAAFFIVLFTGIDIVSIGQNFTWWYY